MPFTVARQARRLPESARGGRLEKPRGHFAWLTPRSNSRTSQTALRVPSCFQPTIDLTPSHTNR